MLQNTGILHILTYECASRHCGAQFFDIGTSKTVPRPSVFYDFDFTCNFSTSERQKVVRACSVLYMLTSKCASRYSGVQFFDIATSKSGPRMLCFVHFDFEMCFSLQRRAIFAHINFKKCSEPLSFLACWLQNALLATAACNFWFLLWPHDSAPAALTSLLFDSPDTRIIGKTQHFATSLTFGAGVSSFFWLSRYCIFFLLTLLHLLTLFSSDFISSICFSSAFQLSILSEVYYLNFLRLYIYTYTWDDQIKLPK